MKLTRRVLPWLLLGLPVLALGQSALPPPPNLTITHASSGTATLAWAPAASGKLYYRINAWYAYAHTCWVWPIPAQGCQWSVFGASPGATAPPPPTQPADVWTSATSYTYVGLAPGQWNFWMQACTSATDPTTCGPMSQAATANE